MFSATVEVGKQREILVDDLDAEALGGGRGRDASALCPPE